jgi:1,4-alpha-glucan branching enzyme
MKPKRDRKNHQHTNGHDIASRVVRVEFKHPTAEVVAIAGSFNDWHPGATQMVALGEGRWLKELVLPPGTYEYLFVADGQWLPDPLATKTVSNPFGGLNSVFEVSGNGVQPGNGSGSTHHHRRGAVRPPSVEKMP